jgi:hypothetical protein
MSVQQVFAFGLCSQQRREQASGILSDACPLPQQRRRVNAYSDAHGCAWQWSNPTISPVVSQKVR